MNPYNFSLLFFSFCTFFISLLIRLKRKDAVGNIYFAFSNMVAVWGVGFSVMISQNVSYESALFAARLSQLAALFIPAMWLHFVLVFTSRLERKKKLLFCIYILTIALAFFSFTPFFVSDVRPVLDFPYLCKLGNLYHVYTAIFFTIVPYAFIQLIEKVKETEGEEHRQLKGFIFATAAGFQGGALTFLPCYGIMVPQYGFFLMPFYPFIMAYFMMRRQLFSLEELAQAARRDKLAAMGTLAASINHEIKNPLYVIHGLAESHLLNFNEGIYSSLEQTIEKSNEILNKTVQQSSRAMEIIRKFAVFAKESIKEDACLESVNLKDVLEDIFPLISHEIELDKIQLIRNLPEDLSSIKADPRHIEEILFNLIVNACHAIKSRKEEDIKNWIEISASQNNGTVQIQIEDTGPGIPTNQLAQIFEPFYTTKTEGTGLGLYVTKQLVERNGGKISVKSKIDSGTVFFLEFKR